MRSYPAIPTLEEAPPDHLRGHVWVEEYVDGDGFRFAVAGAGHLRFGDAEREFDGETPPAFGHAVRFVERTFALEDYLATVEDPTRYTFVGVATHRRAVDYDWDRLPPVLGVDVWDGAEARWLPPDRVQGVFDRLGPPPVTTVEKEVSVDRRDLSSYELPTSAWSDGPAAGLVFRDKRGNRAMRVRDAVREGDRRIRLETTDPRELAERFVTDERIARRATALRERDEPVAFDALFEAVVDDVARAHHRSLFHGVTDDGALELDWGRFRGAVAERVRRWLDARD